MSQPPPPRLVFTPKKDLLLSDFFMSYKKKIHNNRELINKRQQKVVTINKDLSCDKYCTSNSCLTATTLKYTLNKLGMIDQ